MKDTDFDAASKNGDSAFDHNTDDAKNEADWLGGYDDDDMICKSSNMTIQRPRFGS